MLLVLVPVVEEADDRPGQIVDMVVDRVLEDAPSENAEEDLDLIDPRRVDRRVVEVEAGSVTLVEFRPPLVSTVMVNVEVIPNYERAHANRW